MDKKQVKKLKEFEETKYKQFHDTMLRDDGNPRGDKTSALSFKSPTRKDTLSEMLMKSPTTNNVVKSSNIEIILD